MYINSQLYSECQLVAAINAAFHLRGTVIDQGCPDYEFLVNLVKARYGPALLIQEAHRHLKIKCEHIDSTEDVLIETLMEGYPVEVPVFTEKTGMHSVLASAYENYKGTPKVRVHNLYRDEWLTLEDFMKIVIRLTNIIRFEGKFFKFTRDNNE